MKIVGALMSKVRGNMVLSRTVVVSLGIALTGLCLTSVAIKVLLAPQSIKVQIAFVISNYYKKQLSAIIHKIFYETKPRVSAQLLYTKLVLCCPLVKSVIIKQKPDRSAYITVHSVLPVMRIISQDAQEQYNISYVLTDAHTLVSASYFDSFCLEHLSCLYIPSYSILTDLGQVLKEHQLLLTQELFGQYKITWHSPQKIVLELKKAPGCSIIANQELLASKKRVYAEQVCLHIYKKKGDTRVIDIRFGNYLVCT